MPRWSTNGAAGVVQGLVVPLLRDVVIPSGGLYAILTDRPLTSIAAGAYLVMMGLPLAGVIDRMREKRNTEGQAPTPPADPSVRTP